jgi:hypothetical protein
VYNKYFAEGENAFSKLYEEVENEASGCVPEEKRPLTGKRKSEFSIGRLLGGIDIDKVGILPIVLLLLLLMDADDDEKLIIIVLAVIFGI